MAEDRPPRRSEEEPDARKEDEGVPRHRVVWEGPLVPPDMPITGRGTIRMKRPNLATLAGMAPPPAPIDPPPPSVIDEAPTTERVPQAQQPQPKRPPPEAQRTQAYTKHTSSQPPQANPQAQPPPQPTPQAQQPYAPPPQPYAPRQLPPAYGPPPTAMTHVPRGMSQPPPATPYGPNGGPAPTPRVVAPRVLDPRLVLLTEPDSARAAAFRLLRDNLLEKGLPRVLAISSPAPQDGKTTCAINLALALAEHSPARILLLDGNMFAPALAGIFNVDDYTASPVMLDFPGLASYKIVELAPFLHVAAIVPRPGEPTPRFDKHRFAALLDHLCRVGYDHIIVDGPAVEASPTVAQLLAGVDAVVLAVRQGRTTSRALRRAVDAIPGGKALGVTLIG